MTDAIVFLMFVLLAPAITMLTLRLCGYRIEMTFTLYRSTDEVKYIYSPPNDQNGMAGELPEEFYDDADWWKYGKGEDG